MSNIVIIGSGPAGVSAALYTARAGVDTTVLTRGPGALDRAEGIQNYYGFAAPISGAELERQGILVRWREGYLPAQDVPLLQAQAFEPLRGVLAHDPRPSYQSDPERMYGVAFAGKNVKFTVEDGVLTVRKIEEIS